MRQLLENTAQRAISFLEQLPERGVAPTADAVANLAKLNEPLPNEPTDADEVLRVLDEKRYLRFVGVLEE